MRDGESVEEYYRRIERERLARDEDDFTYTLSRATNPDELRSALQYHAPVKNPDGSSRYERILARIRELEAQPERG